jgi:dTDP-4-dehydrorhamnose 3,5-epimerase-like enzyme
LKTLNLLEEIQLQSFSDTRGFLGVMELIEMPHFRVQRFYFITRVPEGATRGSHAHKTLKQYFFALRGSFTLSVTDGLVTENVTVRAEENGFFLKEGMWRELTDFSSDCVCLVLASAPYDQNDYIQDFNEYVLWKNHERTLL